MMGFCTPMELPSSTQSLSGHIDRVWSLAWSPTGTHLASCSSDKTVRIWSTRDGEAQWRCEAVLEDAHDRTIRCCSWAPGGRALATASFDSTTAVWELREEQWTQVATLEGHENEVKSVSWSPSGSMLATCGRDKTVWIWEALPGHEFECIDVKYGHSQDVKHVCWHPSEQILVSTSYDDSIKLWAEENGEWICQQTLSGPRSGHSGTVWCASFSPDGAMMASCSDDATVRIWDCHFERGFREPKWRMLTAVSGHHDLSIFSISWSLNDLVATGSRDNSVKIFRVVPQQALDDPSRAPSVDLVASLDGAHAADVNAVAWHPSEAGLLASAGDDELIKLWRLEVS